MKKKILLFGILLVVTLYSLHQAGAEKIQIKDENEKVTISANNLNQPTLGVAFHLNYPKGWSYKNYNLGPFFQQKFSDSIQEPVVLVSDNPQSNELIVGVSLKRNEILPTGSGEIITFNFATNESEPKPASQKPKLKLSVTKTSVRQLAGKSIIEAKINWSHKR